MSSRLPLPNDALPPWLRQLTAKQAALAGLGLSTVVGGLYINSKNPHLLSRDLWLCLRLARVRRKIQASLENRTVVDHFRLAVAAHPDKEALVFVDSPAHLAERGVTKTSYTYAELEAESNKVANWGLSVGFKEKEIVALMVENRPEFIFIWLGMVKLGVIPALINTNLRGKVLFHSLEVSKASHFFIGREHANQITSEMMTSLGGQWYSCGGFAPGFIDLNSALEANSNTNPPPRPSTKPGDKLCLIYTSGTTGAPKAAVITHGRFISASILYSDLVGISESDRMYTALPLYHSAALVVGMATVWNSKATFILRRHFSARNFWEDIRTHQATVFQYIGELCRYLLTQPPRPEDSQHNLRVALGNGLRPDIWAEFQRRFKIPQIAEFYAATEGNVGLLNTFNKVGAIGYYPPLLRAFGPGRIVKFDIDSEAPVRDPKTGLCINCKVGEIGEMLGQINMDDPILGFRGYTDPAATNKKILRDVFTKGDMWFRTGDLMRIDREGYVYFVDRIGDTFRWKGENVATTEVAEVIITGNVGVLECNVYGVKVPHRDGRAGMARIIPANRATFDLDAFYKLVKGSLPSYAAPLFIRVASTSMEVTATFKHKKPELVAEGFNPDLIKDDDLYFRDDVKGAFVPLTAEIYEQITNNRMSAKL